MKRTKTAWRIVIATLPELGKPFEDVALVYNEHLALRITRYGAPWLGLDDDERLEMFQVQVEGEDND